MSIDRIDPTKGYTEDNVQLVCAQVNMMKSDMSLEAFDLTKVKPFSMGYLAGFQAEKRDIEKRELEDTLHIKKEANLMWTFEEKR